MANVTMWPTAIVASGWTDVELSDIDFVADEVFGDAGAGTNKDLRLSFDTPPVFPLTGGQVFTFTMKKSTTGTGPTVRVFVGESGAPLANSGDFTVTTIGWTEYTLNWDASLLADPTGANVEATIRATSVSGNTLHMDSVKWTVSNTGSTGYRPIVLPKKKRGRRLSNLLRHPVQSNRGGAIR